METKETKICPHCGKEILTVAKKCKYCKQWIEGCTSQAETQYEGKKVAEDNTPVEDVDYTTAKTETYEKQISTYHPPITTEQFGPDEKKSLKFYSYLWIILGAIILVGVIYILSGPSMSGAKKKMKAGDIDGAVKELIELAEDGDDKAIDVLANYCIEIDNTPKVSLSEESKHAVLPWLEKRAESWENGDLADLISYYYYFDHDEENKIKWENIGAKKGNIRCASLIGVRLKEKGEYDKSIPYLLKGTEDDFGYAYYYLAQIFLDPKYHGFDETKGIAYLIKAADNDWKDAMFDVAIRYATGKGVPEDIDKALEYFEASGSHNETWKEYIRKKYKTKHGLEYYHFRNE